MVQPLDAPRTTAEQYRAFVHEAAGESPCFADWASEVARDAEVLEWLSALPPVKRQPNLVFAAARWHGVAAPGPYTGLRAALLSDDGSLRATILSRATQTNEVGRLAVLAPAFALLAERARRPLALIEVGASAGLCLYPDAYSYDWSPGGRMDRRGAAAVLSARTAGPLPIPAGPLDVGWRSGIDLHPLDVTDADQMSWLQVLVWPEQQERRARLDTAIAVTRRDPPRLVTGDLLEALPDEIERARAAGRVVVFHSAVIAYLGSADRDRFAELMRRLVEADVCDWVSNEGDRVLPAIADGAALGGREDERFVLGIDGVAVARAHGHGRSVTWLR